MSSSSVCHLPALPLPGLEIYEVLLGRGLLGSLKGPLPSWHLEESRGGVEVRGGGSYRAAGGRESALGLARRGAGACLAGAAAA